MLAKSKSAILVLIVVSLAAFVTSEALAQCATCATPTVAYYQPQPVAYQTYYRPYSAWYPGYWMDRARWTVWGRPRYSTYYPTYAAYRPAYAVGYRPATYAYTSAYASGCSTCGSYAPAYSGCSTCASSPCSTCTTCARPVTVLRQVTLQPVCGSACAPDCTSCPSACSSCSSCSSCSTTTVTPATYTAPASCPSCAPAMQASAPAGPAPSSYSTEPQPALAPSEQTPTQRTFRNESTNGAEESSAYPSPSSDAEGDDSATYFEAPQLFRPNDRTAQRGATPVRAAVYYKAGSSSGQEQLQVDAAGWTSASN